MTWYKIHVWNKSRFLTTDSHHEYDKFLVKVDTTKMGNMSNQAEIWRNSLTGSGDHTDLL